MIYSVNLSLHIPRHTPSSCSTLMDAHTVMHILFFVYFMLKKNSASICGQKYKSQKVYVHDHFVITNVEKRVL